MRDCVEVYSTISSREKSPAEHSTGAKGTSRDPPVPVVDEKKARKDLPEFFARLAPNVERMCHELDDWDLLKTVLVFAYPPAAVD
ncbi:MAG: hypothetical protein P4M11_04055 [Candidatus Pacebacteria bacterium]|nr:hypothetical protein [Candidatus Paceibacterota bacterium]